MKFEEMKQEALKEIYQAEKEKYQEYKEKNLSLNMTRGKPGAQQLDLALGILEALHADSAFVSSNGDDCRNYGVWDGLPEMREIFSQMIDVPAQLIILGNNSSLQMMFDCISKGYTHGYGGCTPWCKQEKVKFLCPSPGYDRHFAVTEFFGMELIPVPMLKTGPDMDILEKLAQEDPAIKGCWCVPKYSNPTGITYSDETVRRFAKLRPAAKDFRIMWDNAYCVHDLTGTPETLLSLYEECLKEGTQDNVLFFASTSKISFPGAGVAGVGMSPANYAEMKARVMVQTIGPDKLNQLRHIHFLRDFDGVKALMQKHREVLAPRFNVVKDALHRELDTLGIASWSNPNGGYFVNLDVLNGCAKRVVALCKEAGVELTNAGATYPYGDDPNDSNIRIAPTFPPVEELHEAMAVLCIAVKLAALEKILSEKN